MSAPSTVTRLVDQLEDVQARLAELRRILAPLLDDPGVGLDDGLCVFCHQHKRTWDPVAQRVLSFRPHTEDCPVLRKDDLLGRRVHHVDPR